MPFVVRPLRPNEERSYLQVVNRAVRGLAGSHYPPEAIDGWVLPLDEPTLADLRLNAEHEIRLVVEADGTVVGIGALVPERSELRACYVLPQAARKGHGTALVREMERLARQHGLTRLELAASLNAERFYAALGYEVRERSELVLRNGHTLAAVWMAKEL